jgi:hypothetical protein
METWLRVCFAMSTQARRRCLHCLHPFVPDYRNTYHQRFCSDHECRRASKRASQQRWLAKPQNRNYFREPDNVARVREWRLTHPGYWRTNWHRCASSQPPELPSVPPAEATVTLPPTRTLQEFCRSKSSVLARLVSRLSRCALQDDIAHCAAQVLSEAQCILLRCQLSISLPPPAQRLDYHETG